MLPRARDGGAAATPQSEKTALTLRLDRVRTLARPVAAAVCMAVAVLWFRRPLYALTIVWGAIMIASFVGWGSLVNLWLAPRRWADWGLRAGWGMALFLVTGGYLLAAHLATAPVLFGQVVLGLLALLVTLAIRRPRRWSARRFGALIGNAGALTIVIGAYCFAAFTYVACLGNQRFQSSDDPPLYFTFAQKLAQTGSLLEPFAARRITTFGGQVYLHAAFISVAPICYLNVVDAGISLLIVTALRVGSVGRSGIRARHAVPLGLAFLVLYSLQDVRVNTASLVSSVAAIMTLYRTVRVPIGDESDRPTWPMNARRVIVLTALTSPASLVGGKRPSASDLGPRPYGASDAEDKCRKRAMGNRA